MNIHAQLYFRAKAFNVSMQIRTQCFSFVLFAYKHDYFISKTGFLVLSKTLTVPLILICMVRC